PLLIALAAALVMQPGARDGSAESRGSVDTALILAIDVSNSVDARALAGKLRRLARQGGEFTCVAQMMRFVADKITPQIPMRATRVLLDVSGDGQENCNPEAAPMQVRDELVAIGLTINGLPILEGSEAETLARWYG
ncbi:DUF1194 domain-containing protein, partial [Cupriavidus sp. 2MCAB6]|uniref:DUF1194 domain-containing protein n=1 Tax=Cupriavidus sp. 2MCAB6 TaxID=3232981 RepID=UPI003F8DEA9D